MNLQEKSDLILSFAQVLHANGQSTDDTLAATDRLSGNLGLRTTMIPSWDGLQLEAKEEQTVKFTVDSEPLLVGFDYGGTLIKELVFVKTRIAVETPA